MSGPAMATKIFYAFILCDAFVCLLWFRFLLFLLIASHRYFVHCHFILFIRNEARILFGRWAWNAMQNGIGAEEMKNYWLHIEGHWTNANERGNVHLQFLFIPFCRSHPAFSFISSCLAHLQHQCEKIKNIFVCFYEYLMTLDVVLLLRCQNRFSRCQNLFDFSVSFHLFADLRHLDTSPSYFTSEEFDGMCTTQWIYEAIDVIEDTAENESNLIRFHSIWQFDADCFRHFYSFFSFLIRPRVRSLIDFINHFPFAAQAMKRKVWKKRIVWIYRCEAFGACSCPTPPPSIVSVVYFVSNDVRFHRHENKLNSISHLSKHQTDWPLTFVRRKSEQRQRGDIKKQENNLIMSGQLNPSE